MYPVVEAFIAFESTNFIGIVGSQSHGVQILGDKEAELLIARKVGNVNGDKGLPESLQDNDI